MEKEIELGIKLSEEKNTTIIMPHHNDFLDEVSKDDSTKAKSQRLKQYVIKNLIQPDYIEGLTHDIKWKNTWRKMSVGFYWVANICLLLSTISAFLQAQYPTTTWITICVGVGNICVFLLTKFSEIATKESQICTSNENKALKSLEIDGAPELDGETNYNHDLKKTIGEKK